MTKDQNNIILDEVNLDKNTYNELEITPEEHSRIWFGELTECDFCTCCPNPYRVEKVANGINRYMSYKKKQMEMYK